MANGVEVKIGKNWSFRECFDSTMEAAETVTANTVPTDGIFEFVRPGLRTVAVRVATDSNPQELEDACKRAQLGYILPRVGPHPGPYTLEDLDADRMVEEKRTRVRHSLHPRVVKQSTS